MSKSLIQNSRIISKKGTFHGREVVAFFAVVQDLNGYSVRLVDVRYIQKSDVVALPKVETKSSLIVSVQSPYFASSENIVSDFAFLISQPARAPASK